MSGMDGNRLHGGRARSRAVQPVRRLASAAATLVALLSIAAPSSAAADDPPDQPDPLVTVGEWTDGAIECDATTVEQTRTTTTTPYVLVDGQWELDEAAAVTSTDTRTRDLELIEITPCPLPPQPPDVVVRGEWLDGEIECDATTLEQTRLVTTTPHSFVDGAWVLDPDRSSTSVETQIRNLTDDEITPCPVITPSTVPPTTGPTFTITTTGVPGDGTITTIDISPDPEEGTDDGPIVLGDGGPAPDGPAEPAPSAPTPDLPATGPIDLGLVTLAVLLVGAGSAISLASRRRTTG